MAPAQGWHANSWSVPNFFWTLGEGEGGMFRENNIETCILSRMKQITSSGWMHETSARGWCTGKTQRDGVEREVGGGIRMGNTCKSMADSCQCMAKTTIIFKVISFQLIKINGKKNLKIKISCSIKKKKRIDGNSLAVQYPGHLM